MVANADYEAVLHQWCIVGYRTPFDDMQVILGMIAGDRKRPFPDGRWIMTSVLLSPPDEIGAGSIVRTLDTRYLLGDRLDTTADTPRAR